MSKIYNSKQKVRSYFFDSDGYFTHSEDFVVFKGTGLPINATELQYIKKKGKTARFDGTKWLPEVTDNREKPFYDEFGKEYRVSKPEDNLPADAITTAPTPYDADTQEIRYVNGKWEIHDIKLGEKYYDYRGHEHTVSDRFFKLPDHFTFTPKPQVTDVDDYYLENGSWHKTPNIDGKHLYALNPSTHSDTVGEVGMKIPTTHTLQERKDFHKWTGSKWEYDQQLEKPVKELAEKHWRDSELHKVNLELLNEVVKKNFGGKQQGANDAEVAKAVKYREALENYHTESGFPFSARPVRQN